METTKAEVVPQEPESIEQSGLAATTVEQLILKTLYFQGELYGQDLCAALGLKYSVIQDIVNSLKLQHHVQVRRSLGVGDVAALLGLTEGGRVRARECLEKNQYAGPAPVPVEQYTEMVHQQRPAAGWLTKQMLRKALRGMVITERTLAQIGPALSSSKSLLVYGKPGDGKTFLIESLGALESSPVFIPHAIECQGNIVQVFDPIYHQPLEEEPVSVLKVAIERSYDKRWVKCKRPFIVTGGELTLDMLDLRYNDSSRVYEAPFQLKANNGLYLVDDFGRQQASPAEVLNRWIVPMERRVDYLTFMTGGKMTVPFETFLVFSTNLNPSDLGDEAFLRRIQYKMLLQGPDQNEYTRIFENYCAARRIPCPPGLVGRVLERYYDRTGRPLRRCHPRDVLNHALNLIRFEKLREELTDDLMDRAFKSCFLEEDSEKAGSSPIVSGGVESASDYWGDRLATIPTASGSLAFLASLRDTGGGYRDLESEREFGDAETGRVLAKLHGQCFIDWLKMSAEQQKRDLTVYLAKEGNTSGLARDREGWLERMAPAGAKSLDKEMFSQELDELLETLLPKPEAREEAEVREGPVRLERIA